MRQLFADLTLQDLFLLAGYVQVPMLSAEEVSYLFAEMRKLRPDDNFNPQPDQKYQPSDHCSFLDKNVDYKRQAFDLIEEVFDPHLKRYMPNFEIVSANFYVKPPHSGVFTIHQNWPLLPLEDTTVTLWCPLQDVDVHNGGIHVVPSSHKILPHVEGVLCPPYFKDFQEALIEKYLQPIPMHAGEGLIFDDGLIHWSPVNDAEEATIAVQILCVPSDATPIVHFFDRNHPERFEKIEASKDFFLSQLITDMTVRQPHWKSLGFVENKNRYISEEEFVELLKKGDEIREKIYFPNTTPYSLAITMRNILLDETQNSLLIKRGYIQQQILSELEIQYLLDEIRNICPESDFLPQGDASSHPYIFASYMQNIQKVREVGSNIIQEVLFPHIAQLFDNYRIISCGLFVKAPKGGWIDVHYHRTVVDDLKHWVIDIWCPLMDTNISNGAFHAVPKSHKIFPEIVHNTYSDPPFFQNYTQIIREKYSVALPSKAGQAVIFEDSMLHWSPNNMTNHARYAIHCACIPKEVTPIHVHFNPSYPQQFELYEATDEFLSKTVFGRLLSQPIDLNLLAIVPNNNRNYTLEEFEERMHNADQSRHELLERGDEIRQKIYFPNTTPYSPAMHPETSVSLVHNQGGMTPEPAKVPPVLTRIISTCRHLLGMKPQSAKVLSVPQISGVMRDARAPINQHTISDVTDYYNEWTQRYIEGFGEVFQGSRPDSTDELFDYIIDAANLEDGLTVLDAGCGVCGPAMGLAERRNLTIEAVTLSEVQVAEGQQRIKDRGLQNRITVRKGDFHRLAEIYPPAHFDRILFLESLCHAEDYRVVLRQAKQVLKPGGFIYIKDFYTVDHRSRPDLLELQAEDLRELNRIYCLVMPDLPSTVDIISELGFHIFYMRQPLYTYSSAIWENFMRHTNVFWVPKLGNPDRVIGTIEFLLKV